MELNEITPYGDGRGDKPRQVREMFDNIAPAYDFMNRAMTLGIDRMWRAKAVSLLRDTPHDDLLDVATGTGDFAILMARELDPISVTGVDLSEGMIEVGRAKVERLDLSETVGLGLGDCLLLPFTDGAFDAVTCAFGVRNFADIPAGYREMARVLRPGGQAVILELSVPTSRLIRPFYNLYTRHVIPTVGRLVSKDRRAYSYLPESISAVPQGQQMVDIMLEAGFTSARAIPLTLGVATIYQAWK